MPRKQQSTEADYVVVGSGTSGSVVAGRLAAAGHRVVLLEAGRGDGHFLTDKPGMIGAMHAVPQIKKLIDWEYRTVPQKHLRDRTVDVVRGKVVGGSSSVNGMVYVRGNRADYDDWAAAGNDGWDAASVTAAYKRLEDFEDGEDEFRGAGGPVKITRNRMPQEATHQFIQAASHTLGIPVLTDYNGASQIGVSHVQQNVADGLRYSSSRAYLRGLAPASLEVQTGVLVERIVIENGRAVGVAVTDRRGGSRTIRAGREVIVCGGVVGSPQLLMLSGVGPAAHLREHGIDVVADLPVGDNLHDHMFYAMTFHTTSTTIKGSPLFVGGGIAREVLRPGTTFMANTIFEALAFTRTDRTDRADGPPNLQLHMLPWPYPVANDDGTTGNPIDTRPSVSVMVTLVRPHSRGTLRLAGPDVRTAPLIDFAYLSDATDADVLVDGAQLVREVMADGAFGTAMKGELHPGAATTGEALRESVLRHATSVHHGVGTCRMGVDDLAVVGPDLRVRGVEALRVADASIIPTITRGNTNAPALMIGEQAAAFVLAGR